MAVSYNNQTKQWTVYPDKTDFSTTYTPLKTDNQTNRPGTNTYSALPTNLITKHFENPVWKQWQSQNGSLQEGQTFRTAITGFYALYLGRTPAQWEIDNWRNGITNAGWKAGSGLRSPYFRDVELAFINSPEYAAKTNEYANNAVTNEQNKRLNEINYQKLKDNETLNEEARKTNQLNQEANKKLQEEAEANRVLNNQNQIKNNLSNKAVSLAASTRGGDYVITRDQLKADELIAAGVNPTEANAFVNSLKENYKLFYQTEKLQRWDSKLGSQPVYGDFDPQYYKTQNPTVEQAWREAVAKDDLDITERYGENNFYWQHYSNVGKIQGLRGNKEEDLAASKKYEEKAPTDQELQTIRDLQLNVDTDTITQRLLNVPKVSNEWTKARQGDKYWTNLAKEKYLDVTKPDDFAVLFRLSERPEDKQIILNYNINAGSGITQLEDALNEAIGAKATVDVKKFAALNQNVLKETIQEMKKVRAEQEMMSFYRGFAGFSEVVDINKELANSILGDTGVGGVLSFTSAGKAEEDLLGALQNVTGMRNNVSYNWQQWFDKTIKEKYGIDYSLFEPLEEKRDIINAFIKSDQKVFDNTTSKFNAKFIKDAGFSSEEKLIQFLEKQGEEGKTILNTIKGELNDSTKSVLLPIEARLTADIKTLDEAKNRGLAIDYTLGDKTEIMNIEAEFARNYIDEYLMPRFNTSRSMDEFVEYLDVRQEEKNPFQTQDTYDALASLGKLYSDQYLDRVKKETARGFNPDFYFNPTGDISRTANYAKQKETVEADWEKAKAGDPYWAQQAYRFGVDINNKNAFARMHFEVKGQGQGFDAAEDITNAGKIKDYIYNTVVPALKEEAFKSDSVFGQFITPEEFADEMLEGLDPEKTPEAWKEILQRYGLSSFAGTLEELKGYIVETLRTGSAQDIREQIKYLNEKRQKPTQEILGVTYIDRPEDYKDEMAKPSTELYYIFQKAGYQGTEDEFYENMFPDLDRSEQTILTKAGRDTELKTYGLDLSDPFASLGTIESFFPAYQEETEKEIKQEKEKDSYASYFRIGLDEDEEETEKSSAAKAFLGEFTSLFKGL